MTEKENKKSVSRRTFLKTSTLVVAGSAIAYGAVSVPLLRKDRLLLRPPGALGEDIFLASCIKCGQCLQVCPPQVIKLAGISQGFGIGTPYIIPREGACILCSGLPCVLACPTGALAHELSLGKDAEMGLAVISGPDTCLSVRGVNDLVYRLQNLHQKSTSSPDQTELKDILTSLIKRLTEDEKKAWQNRFSLPDISDNSLLTISRQIKNPDLEWIIKFVKSSGQARKACQVCLEECPIKDEKTIVFVSRTHPDTGKEYIWPSVRKTCVGCGVCEEKCPTPAASITISPRLKWSEKPAGNQTGNHNPA
ncbi:Ferredoxin-type protein NapG (periplasmic nitrate reductase) [Olavius sp. associated proteobacterium Delta 1]|nr:Ferredoxin-type protein NapG (periplasmic nitrate reductase) [Olavius sp. associated proteobacterium Delta 1]